MSIVDEVERLEEERYQFEKQVGELELTLKRAQEAYDELNKEYEWMCEYAGWLEAHYPGADPAKTYEALQKLKENAK